MNELETLKTDKVELGSNYLNITADMDDRQLSEVFGALNSLNGASLFWIGDFLASIETNKGEAYARAYAATDYSPQTLGHAKSVCKRLPRELRVNLSFSHHKEALVESKGSVAVAVDFLRKAEKAGQSVKEMRNSIRLALADSVPNPETDRLQVIDPELLAVIDAFGTIRRFLENTNSGTFSLKKGYVLSEIETLNDMAKAVCH